ncbi:MAG TPA: hypothetical protein VKU90_11080 [Caulobacteraceae bacterium]|nr:hypothetical protein [Caulobacteraceae bacterium]
MDARFREVDVEDEHAARCGDAALVKRCEPKLRRDTGSGLVAKLIAVGCFIDGAAVRERPIDSDMA